MAQDRAGVAEGGEPLEHGGHREPHRLVGILHHRPVGAAAVADRERHRQLAAPGLAQQRTPHARLQDVQFRREQRPLDAQQEPVVGALGVIDDDLGRSGASAERAAGLPAPGRRVGLGDVGLVLGLEVSRLARNCRDWHQLLELCALFGALIADSDGVYDPTS